MNLVFRSDGRAVMYLSNALNLLIKSGANDTTTATEKRVAVDQLVFDVQADGITEVILCITETVHLFFSSHVTEPLETRS